MKKITLLLLSLIALTSLSSAQADKDTSKESQLLFNVKSILEKHFAGTNVRSLQKSFEIKPEQSNGYSFVSEVNGLFSTASNKALSNKLNKVLRLKDSIKLTGTLYFDDRIDSALVDIEYKREDTVYHFASMSGYAVPRGGFKAFSKRLHDFIKEQIALGKLVKDSIAAIKSINLLIHRDGSFTQAKQSYISKAIELFLSSEPRWNPSINTPIAAVVNFSIIRYYIDGDAWPLEDNIAKGVSE